MSTEQKYWFPAKRYGWGWGPPSAWQGWVVLIVYLGLLGLGVSLLRPHQEPWYFLAYVGLLSVLLVTICWLKGEPPRWRWGKR